LIPLKDNIPTARLPLITIALIAINVAVFIWQLAFPTDPRLSAAPLSLSAVDQSSLEYGAIPYRITHPSRDPQCAIGAINDSREAGVVCQGTVQYDQAERRGLRNPSLKPIPLDQAPWWVTLFSSMFMHGGLLHIAFNMLFLWVFGNNIEDSMGRGRFVLFYLLGGLVAAYSQAALHADSTVPLIGASGAVAAVLGGYAVLYPRARVLSLIIIIFFVTLVEIPALALLAVWFLLQFIGPIQDATSGLSGGVAYYAHIGGFLFGLAAIRLFARRARRPDPALPAY
jgi:membrane associated rhomboid family serine protease